MPVLCRTIRRPVSAAFVALVSSFATSDFAQAQSAALPRPAYDFRDPAEVRQWMIAHDVARLESTPEGMAIAISGPDPYITGPSRSFPPGVQLLLKARIKSDQGGTFQVFFMRPGEGSLEERSVRIGVPAGDWKDLLIPLPSLGAGTRFRLDPPGSSGTCKIAWLAFSQLITAEPPQWPAPTFPSIDGADAESRTIRSSGLVLQHSAKEWGGFILSASGSLVASGWNRPMIGYLAGPSTNPRTRWLDIASAATVKTRRDGDSLVVEADIPDHDGGRWRLSQRFRPTDAKTRKPPADSGAIEVTTEVEVNVRRRAMFLPLLVVLPGFGSFSGSKSQGIFAGVEYLDNEPSSSTADLTGPLAIRRVPDSAKITFPLMAIQARDRYVGMIWNQDPKVSALFDSPDRLFGSNAHVLGLIAPGSEPTTRVDGSLFPFEPVLLEPGKPLRAEAMLIGGTGTSVVPAIRHYEALRGLPARPPLPDPQAFLRLTASGWLETSIIENGLVRHALAAGAGFALQPAADASWMLDWLADVSPSPLTDRLKLDAAGIAARVPSGQEYHAILGHIRIPTYGLVRGDAATSIEQARQTGWNMLGRFDPDGGFHYQAPASGTDMGRTHFSREASGLSAHAVAELLRAAVDSGDPGLLAEGLLRLRKLDRFADGVPRGGQTWEIPLHTPDILGSADMVRSYLIGYELTGRPEWLEAAKDWAWTGVPFVYLVNPTGQAVGPYATTPVLGATQWVAPVWIGLPVQWCGIVYAEAIARLARHDPDGPWRSLAEGITASAMQQVYRAESPHHGLLPDSFDLRAQTRNPADINPGTLQPLAMRLLFGSVPYEMRVFRKHGLIVHAPGGVVEASEDAPTLRFSVAGWSSRPASVVIHGFKKGPSRVHLNGQDVAIEPPHRFLAPTGTLILHVSPSPRKAAIVIEP